MQWLAGPISRVYAGATETEVLGKGLINSIAETIRCTSGGVGTYATSWITPSCLGFLAESLSYFQETNGLVWVDTRGDRTGIFELGLKECPSSISYVDTTGIPSGVYRPKIEAFLIGVRDTAGGQWLITVQEA